VDAILRELKTDLRELANPQKAKAFSRFFKTGKGQYGEGDIFLGIMVPQQLRVAKKYIDLPLNDIKTLLSSRTHECRLVALLILVAQYQKAGPAAKEQIAGFYLENSLHINNWDLVDLSAPNILGEHLYQRDAAVLYRLAVSENVWERRIAFMATFAFIKKDRFRETLQNAELLLHDKHDLIHKASGWMLREVGKRDLPTEEIFLENYAYIMPRTMLRYAIEKCDETKRRYWLARRRT